MNRAGGDGLCKFASFAASGKLFPNKRRRAFSPFYFKCAGGSRRCISALIWA